MGFRYIARATQNGILNCAMRISGGAGILLVVAMRWLPAIWIEATSLPEIPYWLRRSRIASTAVWAVMWQEKRFIIIVKVRKVSPSPRVNSARSLSLQNALRNPAPPSSTVLGPVKPSAARLAARTPPDVEPAIPNALLIFDESKCISFPLATAAPNGPKVPGA